MKRNTNSNAASSVSATIAERGKRYGKFPNHAAITQSLKQAMYNTPAYQEGRLTDTHREALEMIQHKIGRILNGDPNYADNWHDIAGYAQLAEAECDGDN